LSALLASTRICGLDISPHWRPASAMFRSGRGAITYAVARKGVAMSSTAIIQVVAGVLFVVILIVLIQRRRTKTK
jgi:hypothetical protein